MPWRSDAISGPLGSSVKMLRRTLAACAIPLHKRHSKRIEIRALIAFSPHGISIRSGFFYPCEERAPLLGDFPAYDAPSIGAAYGAGFPDDRPFKSVCPILALSSRRIAGIVIGARVGG